MRGDPFERRKEEEAIKRIRAKIERLEWKLEGDMDNFEIKRKISNLKELLSLIERGGIEDFQ